MSDSHNSRSKKALFVIDSLGSGGAQRQMVSIAKALKDAQIEVHFFIYFPEYDFFEAALIESNIPIHKYRKTRRFDIGMLMHLRRLIREQHYDAVLSFMLTPSLYAELACATIPASQRPRLCFSDRSTFEQNFRPTPWFRLRHQTHRFADVITTNSENHRQRLGKLFPWMKSKTQTIYNGVDDALLVGAEQAPVAEPYLLSVSRLIGYKNFVNLAKALVICQQRGEPVPTVLWLGKVFEREDVRRDLSLVRQMLKEAGIEDKLRFLGEVRDTGTYYRHATALIHPSFIEGFSNAVAEAMCWGLPCILGNISDHQKIVSTYQNGIVFDVNDPSDIADAISRFMKMSTAAQEEMGQRSRQAASEMFDMTVAAEKYRELLGL